MKLHKRLKVDLEEDIALEPRLKLLKVSLEDGADPELTKPSCIDCREQVALAYYLLEDHASARQHGEALVGQVEDYLFGDWRDTYTVQRATQDERTPDGWGQVTLTLGQEGCRREMTWMRELRAGLLWALCLNKQDAVSQLAQYPGEDLPDEAYIEGDFGSADKAYFILLARVLCSDRAVWWTPHTAIIEQSRKKKPKLLLDALDRVFHRDANGLQVTLAECIRHHIKRELPRRGLENKVAIDASILYHAAKCAGVQVAIPEKFRDHLVILD